MPRQKLSASEARKVALAAQGLDRNEDPVAVDVRHIRRAILTMGLLQLDFVNVLVPAHYLVVYSRLGQYKPETFRRLVYDCGEFTEQWAHEASIVPMQTWPLLEHRRRCFTPWPNSSINKIRNKARYLAQVLEIIREKGPVTSNDLPQVAGPRRKPGDWHRSVPRAALEQHFGVGTLAVRHRLANFQRVYDLTERVIDAPHRVRVVADIDAQRELLRCASVACGIATLNDLADYFRMSPRDARPRVQELQEEGSLIEVQVEGWNEPGLLARNARIPRSVSRCTLLSPFDPLVWYRPRAERLFDFHYRIEIYVPEAKRRWGYYVLPFLCGDRLVARVDLKADRPAGTLQVRAAHLEPGAIELDTSAALANELTALAAWLGLGKVAVGRKGNLARALRRACKVDR